MASSPSDLEDWLDESAAAWLRLRKQAFLDFFAAWREAFEPLFTNSRATATDVAAMAGLEARLPLDCMVFCMPGYEHAPSGMADSFYAFRVTGLGRVDRDLLNDHDAAVADLDLGFCCMFTHEVGSMADPQLWDRSSPGRPVHPSVA